MGEHDTTGPDEMNTPASRPLVAASNADTVLEHVANGCDIIVPLGNGEPVTLLDAIERGAATLTGVKIHQMHVLHDRPYLHGAFGDRLRHISYFLSHVTRPCFRAGTVDLVPNNFSEVSAILRETTNQSPRPCWCISPRSARIFQPRAEC